MLHACAGQRRVYSFIVEPDHSNAFDLLLTLRSASGDADL